MSTLYLRLFSPYCTSTSGLICLRFDQNFWDHRGEEQVIRNLFIFWPPETLPLSFLSPVETRDGVLWGAMSVESQMLCYLCPREGYCVEPPFLSLKRLCWPKLRLSLRIWFRETRGKRIAFLSKGTKEILLSNLEALSSLRGNTRMF